MSHFLYIHKDMTNVDGVWKLGVTMTPYSAVRARQKFCWNKFSLDYLYFGVPEHVMFIENTVKEHFAELSGKKVKGFGSQTEMFRIDINILRKHIDSLIKDYDLQVQELVLSEPYSAANSGECPFGIPTEHLAREWLDEKIQETYSQPRKITRGLNRRISARKMFTHLFEEE